MPPCRRGLALHARCRGPGRTRSCVAHLPRTPLFPLLLFPRGAPLTLALAPWPPPPLSRSPPTPAAPEQRDGTIFTASPCWTSTSKESCWDATNRRQALLLTRGRTPSVAAIRRLPSSPSQTMVSRSCASSSYTSSSTGTCRDAAERRLKLVFFLDARGSTPRSPTSASSPARRRRPRSRSATPAPSP